jgi:hypothetical protein
MKSVKLKEYGAVLTGREFGAEVWKQLSATLNLPAKLDFEGVEAMGSSFGDEVIPPLAKAQGNKISLINANDEVRTTIEDVAHDAGIVVTFECDVGRSK